MQSLSLLCSATMDEGKREINIISSVGYFLCIYEFFFYYRLTCYFSLSIQYRLAYTREEARCGVRLFYIWTLKYKEAIYEVHMVQIHIFSFFLMNSLIFLLTWIAFFNALAILIPLAYWTNDQRKNARFLPISSVLKSSRIRTHLGKVLNFSEEKDYRNTKLQPEKKSF